MRTATRTMKSCSRQALSRARDRKGSRKRSVCQRRSSIFGKRSATRTRKSRSRQTLSRGPRDRKGSRKRSICQKRSSVLGKRKHSNWGTSPAAALPAQPGQGWQVFCDLDGVLADFDRGVAERTGKKPGEFRRRRKMWRRLAPPNTSDFFGELPWMSDGAQLWNFLAPLSPKILSGSPSGDWAEPQKRRWCMEQLKLPDERVHIVDPCDKAKFSHPGAVLVDDWLAHRPLWEARGGIFVHYTSAQRSIALLSGVLRHLTITLPAPTPLPQDAQPAPLETQEPALESSGMQMNTTLGQ